MKSISVDIESFSSADLAKSGMYRYAEAEDFEILLFGYSVDGGQVRVVDLARGELIPKEILQALTDTSVVKWAFNAAFERICLSRYLGLPTGTYLDPTSWRCTMVWSAYMGLPLSLLGVGTVLKLEKRKLAAGKDLIRYFCTPSAPTIANGKRTRNRPSHAPEKWKLFVEYNKRDVEVELAIHKRLSTYPVPDAIWDEYHLDQRINDRGVLIDRELVRSAIKLDSLSRHELVSKMKAITDLENPNSVSQVKTWLSENGLEVDSLGKKDVIAALPDAPREIREVLELRLQLAKSSVRKYQAMENAACSDDRARGMFQFYGASRTGRWCLTGDHEVLTIHGWDRLDSWKGGLIASWSPVNEGVVFSHAKALCFDYEGPMYEYRSNRIAQVSTPDHKMYFKRQRGGAWSVGTVEQMATGPACIPFTGYRMVKGRPDNDALRVLVMTQADGHYAEDGSVCYNFTKQRKIERCKTLLRRAGMVYTLSIYDQADRKYHRFRIANRDVPLWLRQFRSKTFGTWLFDESADIFFDELPHWDGYRPAPNSIQYTTCNKVNADLVQAFAHLSGRVASLKPKKIDESRGNCQPSYNVSVWLTPGNCHEISKKPTITDFKGKVFCAQTQSGYFLVRREGRVWVTGNSGRLIQMQNLRRNSIEDLAVARTLVKEGDYEAVKMLYGNVPDTLSQLVRTAFIPRKGYRFIVSDFSAIEARVLSWLAGETWRMDIFAEDGDIYCASASQMFQVPVEKHGRNAHLRQKGKVSELALGFGGSVGALTAMGALDMGLKEDELRPLVDAWRQSNPNIVQFWWDVDKAALNAVREGITTEIHNLTFSYEGNGLFITLPSARKLAYVRPKIETNVFGSDCITYEGTGSTKKWERIATFGGKLAENIIQAISRDLLCHAMQHLESLGCRIVMHIHDEVVIEAPVGMDVQDICRRMSRVPPWAEGLLLNADGYETDFYKKD
jgi:hypothetical protein